jgi:hypothetical protein
MTKQDTTTKLAATEARLKHTETQLKRWQTRLKRAANKVFHLDNQRRRYSLMLAIPNIPIEKIKIDGFSATDISRTSLDIPAGPIPDIVVENVKAGLALKEEKPVPSFLDRSDPHVAAKMTAARKKAEAEERRKMPLTGRDALKKIREKK